MATCQGGPCRGASRSAPTTLVDKAPLSIRGGEFAPAAACQGRGRLGALREAPLRPLSIRLLRQFAGEATAGQALGLRRAAITLARDQGLSYRQVQMMSGHADPKTVMRDDYNRENLDQNAVNLLTYD